MIEPSSEEIAWRTEFEKAGESAIRDSYNFDGTFRAGGEWRLHFIRQWLREKEIERERRERAVLRYIKLTFYAAITAVAVGIIGIVVTMLFGHLME
jgi:hypothetical protein